MGFIPGRQQWFNTSKLIYVIHHNKKMENKMYKHFSVNAENAFEKIQHLFMMKTVNKLSIEEMYPKRIKPICDKPIANTIFNNGKLKGFPPRSGTRQGCTLLSLEFNTVLEVPARAIETRNIQTTQSHL